MRYKIKRKQEDGSFVELSLDTSIDSVYRVKDGAVKSLSNILNDEYAPIKDPNFTGSISLERTENTSSNNIAVSISNVNTLDWNGNSWYAGDIYSGGEGQGDSNAKKLATEEYVDEAVSGLIDSAPGALDTLNELAAALGDDPNFATTVTNNISNKLNKPETEGTEGQVLAKAADGSNVWIDNGIDEESLNDMLTNTFGFVADTTN